MFYRFHYDFFMNRFPNARLIFTDTDSLYYYVEGEDDLEKKLFEDKIRDKYLDFSDYPVGAFYLLDAPPIRTNQRWRDLLMLAVPNCSRAAK